LLKAISKPNLGQRVSIMLHYTFSRSGVFVMARTSFLERIIFSPQLATSHGIYFLNSFTSFQNFFLFHEFRSIMQTGVALGKYC